MGRVLGLLSAALLLVGGLLGLLPVHAAGVSCGSAFHASSGAADVADFTRAADADLDGVRLSDSLTPYSAACSDARSNRMTPAVIVLVLGGLGSVVALGLWARARETSVPA